MNTPIDVAELARAAREQLVERDWPYDSVGDAIEVAWEEGYHSRNSEVAHLREQLAALQEAVTPLESTSPEQRLLLDSIQHSRASNAKGIVTYEIESGLQ